MNVPLGRLLVQGGSRNAYDVLTFSTVRIEYHVKVLLE